MAEVERQREEKQMNEDMCRQLTEDVARLEATVHDLECRDLQSIDPDEVWAILDFCYYRRDILMFADT